MRRFIGKASMAFRPESVNLIGNIDSSPQTTVKNVWFVDVVTACGPECLHSIPVHVALERSAEILNANYIAIVDQDCPFFRGTEQWQRVLSFTKPSGQVAPLVKERQYYRAFVELKNKLSALCEFSMRTRSVLRTANQNASYFVIHLDWANFYQIFAVWLSAASLSAARNKTIVWVHFDRITAWPDKKIGRLARRLFKSFPVKVWITAYTRDIAEKSRKDEWAVDILPLPLTPALDAFARTHKQTLHEKPDKLVCWLFVNRPEQGLGLLPSILNHSSARNFPKNFIKCFISEKANITEDSEVDVVRLPYVSEEEHRLHFNECEVVLLPYDAQSMNGAMSMVFIEAVATGKIPIVSDGTVMATELRRFELEDLVIDFVDKFSWAAVSDIIKDVGIRERLKSMAEVYVREHGALGCAQSLYKGLKKIHPEIALNEPRWLS